MLDSCDTRTNLDHLSSQSNNNSTKTKEHKPSQFTYALERYVAEQDQYRSFLVQGKVQGDSDDRPAQRVVLNLPGQQRGTRL